MEKLTELKLHASKFAAIKALMVQIQDYIKNGEPQQINIVFAEFGRRIKGTLETNRHVESSVKLLGGDERPPSSPSYGFLMRARFGRGFGAQCLARSSPIRERFGKP